MITYKILERAVNRLIDTKDINDSKYVDYYLAYTNIEGCLQAFNIESIRSDKELLKKCIYESSNLRHNTFNKIIIHKRDNINKELVGLFRLAQSANIIACELFYS